MFYRQEKDSKRKDRLAEKNVIFTMALEVQVTVRRYKDMEVTSSILKKSV